MEIEKYLPIGTVLMLKEAQKRIMIIGYLPVSGENSERKVYDYAACIYPEGILSADKTLLFNHDQIDKVYYLGNNDEETNQFLTELKSINKDDILKEIDKQKNDSSAETGKPELIIED